MLGRERPGPPVRPVHAQGRLVGLHEVRGAHLLADRCILGSQLLGGVLQEPRDLADADLEPPHRGDRLLDPSHGETHHREQHDRAREAGAKLTSGECLVGGRLDEPMTSTTPVAVDEDPQGEQVGPTSSVTNRS